MNDISIPSPDQHTISEDPHSTSNSKQRDPQLSIPDLALTSPSPTDGHSKEVPKFNLPRDPNDNGLFLVGDHSYMAYDVKSNLIPMIQQPPRTPGPSMMRPDGLSRDQSFISVLSDERSSRGDSQGETPLEESNPRYTTDSARGSVSATGQSTQSENEDEELKCRKCGSEKFVVIRSGVGGTTSGFKCRTCGLELS